MLLYTPLPMEVVLEGLEKARDYHEVQIGDVTMILERISDSESKIVKLISTNPNDFLNQRYNLVKLYQLLYF